MYMFGYAAIRDFQGEQSLVGTEYFRSSSKQASLRLDLPALWEDVDS